jgi:DNA-binding PucR family transcriptional regulator
MSEHIPPSRGAADVIRDVSSALLEEPEDVMTAVYEAVFASIPETFRSDPTLAAEVTASSRSNLLHWAASLQRDASSRVVANLSPAVLGIARDVFRLGVEEELLSAYRAGQQALWRQWMRLAFTITREPDVLHESLDIASCSLDRFIDDTVAALRAQLEQERTSLTRESHADKLETATLIIEGAPMPVERASDRLGYLLSGSHVAAVLWTDPSAPDQQALQRAAETMRKVSGARTSLHVIATSSSMWAWYGSFREIDVQAATSALSALSEVRIALGPAGAGVEGFRRSHLDAVETQRLLQRLPDLRVATFSDIELVALATRDEQRASEFVARTLGRLATADPELRATVRTFIREQCKAARAARVLFTHRNTVLYRLQRADELLPDALEGHVLEVGVALEIDHWFGAPAPTASSRSSRTT